MPGPFKITILFNLKNAGWSETYYNNAANANAAFNNGSALAAIRQLMLGQPASAVALRVSDDTAKRRSTLTPIGVDSGFPLPYTAYTTYADEYHVAGVGKVYNNGNQVQRTLWLRGLPDGAFERLNAGNSDAATWKALFEGQFASKIKDGTWLIKHRVIGPPFLNEQAITNWTRIPMASFSRIFMSGPPYLYRPNDVIISRRVPNISPAPGAMVVMEYNPTANSVDVKFDLPGNYDFMPGGSVHPYSPIYSIIDFVAFSKFSARRTGRPFGGTRGRSPARAR